MNEPIKGLLSRRSADDKEQTQNFGTSFCHHGVLQITKGFHVLNMGEEMNSGIHASQTD
jgi:hypothetical protein